MARRGSTSGHGTAAVVAHAAGDLRIEDMPVAVPATR